MENTMIGIQGIKPLSEWVIKSTSSDFWREVKTFKPQAMVISNLQALHIQNT